MTKIALISDMNLFIQASICMGESLLPSNSTYLVIKYVFKNNKRRILLTLKSLQLNFSGNDKIKVNSF